MKTTASPQESIFLRLSRASSLTGKLISDSVLASGLTLAEYNFLRIVDLNPRVTARQIQQELSAAAPSIAQMVAKLEKKGFLKRDRSSSDGRMLHLKLTFWGARALKKGKASLELQLKKKSLSQKLVANLLKDLDVMIDELEKDVGKEA